MIRASLWLTAIVAGFCCALPVLHAQTISVPVGQSIQKAIDAAPAGAVIQLDAGAYPELLAITKPITLQGAGWEKTIVGPEKSAGFTPQAKEEFFRKLEATQDKQERIRIAVEFASGAGDEPTLMVKNVEGVAIRGIRFRGPPMPGSDAMGTESLLAFNNARKTVVGECAIVGPYMNGVSIVDGSDVEISKSLIAAIWNTGVAVYRSDRTAPAAKAHLIDSDVRNCYHRCVTLSCDGSTIEKCRISGSAWHGIRYDNCSPTIIGNQIFGHARSGIYASGTTAAVVKQNVFSRNEMDGMSCWFENADTIEQNTFVANLREGLLLCGPCKPTVSKNIFANNPVAVWLSVVAKDANSQMASPNLAGNVFWENERPVMAKETKQPVPANNQEANPKFVSAANQDFALSARSPARQATAGAADPITVESPFPLQPQEKAIIPDSDTRDYAKWNKSLASAR